MLSSVCLSLSLKALSLWWEWTAGGHCVLMLLLFFDSVIFSTTFNWFTCSQVSLWTSYIQIKIGLSCYKDVIEAFMQIAFQWSLITSWVQRRHPSETHTVLKKEIHATENEWVDTVILSYVCEYSLTWKWTFISFLCLWIRGLVSGRGKSQKSKNKNAGAKNLKARNFYGI